MSNLFDAENEAQPRDYSVFEANFFLETHSHNYAIIVSMDNGLPDSESQYFILELRMLTS